jgi:dTDP-4-amino-4,6-dideoxygalactose transaminase
VSELALFGGRKAKTKPFPTWPQWDEEEERALRQVLDSGIWWRTPGNRTLEFEKAFADFTGARHGIAVTNGTHALEVVLAALGIGPRDEVIIPDFTFVATASSVLAAGALPVPVDVVRGTYCIDPDLVEAAISSRTKAIIAVHLGGHPADLDRLVELSRKRGIALVEDCAHAHGSEWRNRQVGTFGVAGTFSFQASKLMTAGEGGVIVCSNDGFEERARSVHDCGRLPGRWFYDHFQYGSNFRLSEWQGALLSVQLRRLPSQRRVRFRNALQLNRLLGAIEGITPQALDERCTHNGHYTYIFHYDARAFQGLPTRRFIEALKAEGIPEQASYPPIHRLDLFTGGTFQRRLGYRPRAAALKRLLRGIYPVTEEAAGQSVWIPHYALLGDEQDIAEIAGAVRKIQRNVRELAAVSP